MASPDTSALNNSKLDALRKAFAWKGRLFELKDVAGDALLEQPEAMEALMCAKASCEAALKGEGASQMLKAWLAELPLKSIVEKTADCTDKAMAAMCEKLASCNGAVGEALTKVEPWRSLVSQEDGPMTSLADLLTAAEKLLRGPAAQALHRNFKAASTECWVCLLQTMSSPPNTLKLFWKDERVWIAGGCSVAEWRQVSLFCVSGALLLCSLNLRART